MPIALDLDNLKEQYKQKEEGINPEKVKLHLDSFYNKGGLNKTPIYPTADGNNIEEVAAQVDAMCTYLESIGVKNAGGLRTKFTTQPVYENDAQQLTDIKKTMEGMIYSMENSETPAKELGAKYADHAFMCKAGTLTNLQAIVAELSLEGQGVGAYITEQKEALVTAVTLEMYNAGEFDEFPAYDRRQYVGNEIHNISSLKNTIADDFGVTKKAAKDDPYLREVGRSSKKKLTQGLKEKFAEPDVIDAFIASVSGKVTENLPHFDKDKYPERPDKFIAEMTSTLDSLKLGDILDGTSLLKMDEAYTPGGYKDNVESIVRDAITIHLHEKGVINHPEIELVKMRVALETSADAEMMHVVEFSVLEAQRDAGRLDKSLEYMIENNLKLGDTDELGDEPEKFKEHFSDASLATQDPLKYAINNNINLDGMHPVEYAISNNLEIDGKDPLEYAIKNEIEFDGTSPKQAALESVIEKYLETSDLTTKKELEARYKEIHQIGVEGEVELLSLDSNLGAFISDDKNMSLMSEVGRDSGVAEVLKDKELATKCDLALIEKCTQFVEKESQMKPRNYDKLSTMQKVGVAVSMIIPPLAGAVYHVMKKSNKKKKEALQADLSVSIDKVFEDLDKVSKPTPKAQAQVKTPKEQDQVKTPKEQAQAIAENLAPHKAIASGAKAPVKQNQGQRAR